MVAFDLDGVFLFESVCGASALEVPGVMKKPIKVRGVEPHRNRPDVIRGRPTERRAPGGPGARAPLEDEGILCQRDA